MTRMIERWFPCAEVGQAAQTGWGSGRSEKALFTWFATRPLAQAKAAVITSLLPWPDDPEDQQRLQKLVREAIEARTGAQHELHAELDRHHPDGALLVDPFSGRAVIPLEAARLGVPAWGIDYSPVATLAGQLLADYPLRDWSAEPPLPFGQGRGLEGNRLLADVRAVLDEIADRWEQSIADFYPTVDGDQPWGYLWVSTLPCQDCGRRFPLTGSLVLRHPLAKKNDPGQSYRIEADRSTGTWRAAVHDGEPQGEPTLVAAKGSRGKAACCCFCGHVHPIKLHTRLANEGLRQDALVVAADLDGQVGKRFREPTSEEFRAAAAAEAALTEEPDFAPAVPAVPHESIPAGNHDTIRASKYGARTFGDLCNPRQTLGFVRLARTIDDLSKELMETGISGEYSAALAGYAASALVRKLRCATRGTRLRPHKHENSNRVQTGDLFVNEASLAFNYDHFEAGVGDGPATWRSMADDTVAVLRNQAARAEGVPATIQTGSALSLPLPDGSAEAVVTDPPYDNMIDYTDASDLFHVWLKRALATTRPDLIVTANPQEVQEKSEEIIVKRGGNAVDDHRTRGFYDEMIAEAFTQARRVVKPDGVVTIVFGHGDIDVWERLLAAVTKAGLVLTGSWPAQTESGGKGGSANIVTTLTMACRPAPTERPHGKVNEVDAEVRREIADRLSLWEQADLATHDQLMAAVGPALEVVGRYAQVLDKRGQPVSLKRYLVLARQAVREAQDVKIDGLPLDTFDAATRFALDWVRLYGKNIAPASEARWQALAMGIDLDSVVGVVLEKVKASGAEGVRLAGSQKAAGELEATTPTIMVAFAAAAAWQEGLQDAADVLAAAGREDDTHLWAAIGFLADKLPESDPDAQAWTRMIRARSSLTNAADEAAASRRQTAEAAEADARQGRLI